MPFSNLLGPSTSPFDEIVEKATGERLTAENWDLILKINDKVNEGGAKAAKDCLLSLKKRLNHRDPHVIMLALSVIDSCMCNCGRTFQQEVGSKEFVNELRSKATGVDDSRYIKGSNTIIAERTRELLKKWVEENQNVPSFNLLVSLYNELKKEGYDFPNSTTKNATSTKIAQLESQLREEEELNKAIQMSLKEQDKKQPHSNTSLSNSLYPNSFSSSSSAKNGSSASHQSGAGTPGTGSAAQNQPNSRTVKALYDFEAAEDNELTFKAGEIITIIDDSDVNWWKGSNFRGEGLFPASFVTADLNMDVEHLNASEKKKSVQFDENVKIETIEAKSDEKDATKAKEAPKIDVDLLNRCLDMLQNTDPTGERPDPPELVQLEEQCLAMAPLIEAEIAASDKQINLLSDVNVKLMDALNLYHVAMSDASTNFMIQPPQTQPAPPMSSYAPVMPHNFVPGMTSMPPASSFMASQPNMTYQQQPQFAGQTAPQPNVAGYPSN